MSSTLDDVKRASESSGADLIVFSDLRSKAADARKEIDARKGAAAELNKSTQQLKKDKKNATSTLAVATLARNRLQSDLDEIKRLEGYTKPIEEALAPYQKQFDEATKEIEGYNKTCDDLIKIAEDLIKYRSDERDAYNEAKSKYGDLRSNPERVLGSNPSDGDKEQLERYIKTIIEKMESQEKGHEDQIRDTPNWREKLIQIRNATKSSEFPSG